MSNIEKVVQYTSEAVALEAEVDKYLALGDTILNRDEVEAGLARKKTGFGEAIKKKVQAIDMRILAHKTAMRKTEDEEVVLN
jgi:hypothetical protein